MHSKPCGLLDVAGYYRLLLDFLDHAVTERFVGPQYRSLLLTDVDAGRLLDSMLLHGSQEAGV